MADKPLKIEGPRRQQRRSEERDVPIVSNNSFKILGIVGVVVVLVVAGFYYFNWQGSKDNQRAATELGYIRSYYDQGEYEKAINGDPAKLIAGQPVRGLSTIVEDYGSTDAGKAAALCLGDSYVATNQYDKAAEAYKIASESGDDVLKAAGLAGLAVIAENEGKHEEAAKQYAQAASVYPSDFVSPLYLLGSALNYEKAGNNEEAIQRYREITTRYSTSEQNNQARLALARLNVEI